MADEPERPIEKLLRERARQRREEAGPPFELHPANRRILQGEVARQYGGRRHVTGKSFRLWPAFAWGVGLFAVLAAGWWLLPPESEPQTRRAFFAADNSARSARQLEESTPATGSSPLVDDRETARAAPRPGSSAETASIAAASARPPPPAPTAAAPAVARHKLAATDSRGNVRPAASQNFKRIAPGTATNPAPTNAVLVSFRVEQNGRQLRITDADGSVYSGSLQLAASPAQQLLEGQAPVPASASAPPAAAEPASGANRATAGPREIPAGRTYSFRVTGTNLSLNQKVVFSGSIIATNLTSQDLATNSVGSGGRLDNGAQAGSEPSDIITFSNSTIIGKAQIGRKKAFDIQAAPTGP